MPSKPHLQHSNKPASWSIQFPLRRMLTSIRRSLKPSKVPGLSGVLKMMETVSHKDNA